MRELVILGFILMVIGFLLIFAGICSSGNVEYGGVVMIGPLPIVFGNSKNLALLSVLVGILMLLAILVFYFIR